MENRQYKRDHLLVHSIVNEIYKDVSSSLPAGHPKDLRRYAGAFDAMEIGLEESFSFLTLRNQGTEPVSYMCRTGRKKNAVSEGNYFQCSGWVLNENSPLVRDPNELLGTRFYSEEEVDAFAERGSVPNEESLPAPRNIRAVEVDRVAIRAVLYGAMLRWQQGTPQLHIAVPKAEMERYNDYVLGAMKTIWSYFPTQMRAAVGFTSYLSQRREQEFSKFSIIFVPFHMADVNTIRLDGSTPSAYAAMIRSTGMPQLDLMLDNLAAQDDPEERASFLRGIFEDVERDTELKGRSFSPMSYVKWARGLEMLNARGSVSELLPGWVAFAKNKDAFPPTIGRRIDAIIDLRLTPEELRRAMDQELAGERPSVGTLEKIAEKYAPLCENRPACRMTLWNYIRSGLESANLDESSWYKALLVHEDSWGRLTDKKTYGELKALHGKNAAGDSLKRVARQMEEAGALATKRDDPDTSALRDKLEELREQFRQDASAFVDEASLKEMDGLLEKRQRGYICQSLQLELQKEKAVRPEGQRAIRAEQEKVIQLSRLLPDERDAREQALHLQIEGRKEELKRLFSDSRTVGMDLLESVRGTRDYFEALEMIDEQADKLSPDDRGRLRRALAEKRPQSRNAYMEAYRRRYGKALSLRSLRDRMGFFRACVEDDLGRLYDAPQKLDMRQPDAASLLRQIESLRRESAFFGAEDHLQLELDQERLDADMVQRILGLNPADVEGRDKQRVGETSMKLLRIGAFNPEQLCALLKMFAAAGCKLDSPVKAVLSGEAGTLTNEEQLAFLRQTLRLQMESKGQNREKAMGWISDRLEEVVPTAEAEAAFLTLAGEGKRKGGNTLWIVLVSVLGALLLLAVLAIVFNWFGPKEPKGDEEPIATETPADELAIEQAYAEGNGRADGLLDLSGKGLDNGAVEKILALYTEKDALPESALNDEALLQSLGYRTRLKLSGNTGLGDVSALGGLTGLRRLYLDNTGVSTLDGLEGLKRLELLDLRNTQVGEQQARSFAESHPGCLVLPGNDQTTMLLGDQTIRAGLSVLRISGQGDTLLKALDEQTVAQFLASVKELHLVGGPLSALDALAQLPALEYLDLSDAGLTDEKLGALHSLTGLKALDLHGNGSLSDEALGALAGALPNCAVMRDAVSSETLEIAGRSYPNDLQTLDLSGVELSEADRTNIGKLTGLRELDLSGTGISDLKFLQTLTALEQLTIRDNEVEDLSPIASLKQLQILYADGNPIAALTLNRNATLSALEILTISDATDAFPLAVLKQMPKLTILDIGVVTENPVNPMISGEQDLQNLKILKLQNRGQLTEATRAALEARGCVILEIAPSA